MSYESDLQKLNKYKSKLAEFGIDYNKQKIYNAKINEYTIRLSNHQQLGGGQFDGNTQDLLQQMNAVGAQNNDALKDKITELKTAAASAVDKYDSVNKELAKLTVQQQALMKNATKNFAKLTDKIRDLLRNQQSVNQQNASFLSGINVPVINSNATALEKYQYTYAVVNDLEHGDNDDVKDSLSALFNEYNTENKANLIKLIVDDAEYDNAHANKLKTQAEILNNSTAITGATYTK